MVYVTPFVLYSRICRLEIHIIAKNEPIINILKNRYRKKTTDIPLNIYNQLFILDNPINIYNAKLQLRNYIIHTSIWQKRLKQKKYIGRLAILPDDILDKIANML